jgi:hypothetical protein
MRITAISIAIIACLMLAMACEKPNPEATAILTGKVTEADTSIVLTGVKVYEKSHAGLSCLTDSLGMFKLDGVAFEEHNIYLEKDGYKPEVFMFEYTGKLTRPLLSHSVVMTRAGQTP